MGFAKSRQFYEALPLAVKRTVRLVPFGWIAGRAYRKVLARDSHFDRMERADIEAYQEQALGEMLRFATDQVPAYRPFRGAVKKFRPSDALKEFPLLVKDDLQEHFGDYLPHDIDQIPHYEISTGGTSGNQLKFYVDDCSQVVETAFMHRQWKRVGYTPRCRKVIFRGVPFPNLKDGIYWQHNPIYNELQFSPFHMSDKTLGDYIEQIRAFRPEFFHGYPSAIDILTEYVLRNDLMGTLPRIRAILLGSEGPLPGQRERIEKVFRTRVFSWYGHSERLILAGECEQTDTYHQFPDYGLLEIVDDNGAPCDSQGERGELVGTGFLNRSMPLIRYRSGDYATRLEPRCKCGRHWDRFAEVEGRWKQDMVIGHNGANISTSALNMHGPIFDKIVRYQYFQGRAGYCEIRLMVAPAFSETDRLVIEKAYQNKVGQELTFTARVVEDIPLTARGKLKLLESSLSERESD